jgi:hypothetical protein
VGIRCFRIREYLSAELRNEGQAIRLVLSIILKINLILHVTRFDHLLYHTVWVLVDSHSSRALK